MRQQKRLEADNFLSQLSDSGGERIILRAEDLHFLLQVREPLLLALSTFECGDSVG